jgi:uncharacterized repeat protein (TIGR01451 family)
MHGNLRTETSLTSCRLAALLPLVVLCSCQSLPNDASVSPAQPQSRQPVGPTPSYPVQGAQYIPGAVMPAGYHRHTRTAGGASCPCCGPGTLPPFAFTGLTDADPTAPWKPDGIKGPWPKDEYLCDGGDLNHDVYVKRDWTVVGLDQQDTVAHFDTRDGQTLVAASNCVCVYSPRFAAVRQVSSPIIYEGHERMAGIEKPTKVNIHEETRGPKTAFQPEQPIAQIGLDQVQRLRERTRGLLVDQATRLVLAAEAFLPHEDLLFIQRGEFDASEKARLAQRVAAAETWTYNQAPQVLIEGQPAVEARGTATPQITYTYETGGKPCLRLCKIADKSEAKPGEIIQFTLRFDNLGEQKIGNVTIIDNLMPRLEYVAGSAQSSLKAIFSTQEQLPGESLVLRWEIEEPLEVNQGGIVRFQARVR